MMRAKLTYTALFLSLTAIGAPAASQGTGTLAMGGTTYEVTATLCDLPDQIPGAVIAGEAVAGDGSRLVVMVSHGERPGGVWEENVTLVAQEGSYAVTYRREEGSWRTLTPTEGKDPTSPMDAGEPTWIPVDGALLRIDGSQLRWSAVIYGPGTGPEGWESTMDVTCQAAAGGGGLF